MKLIKKHTNVINVPLGNLLEIKAANPLEYRRIGTKNGFNIESCFILYI